MPRLYAEAIHAERAGFDVEDFVKEMGRYARANVAPEIEEECLNIVADWHHKPDFRVRVIAGKHSSIPGGFGFAIDAWPTGPNAIYWKWSSKGTPEHFIPTEGPKSDGFLWFQEDYDPKVEIVNKQLFRGTGEESGALLKRKRVLHPGITPREFEKYIIREYRPRYREHMADAIARARGEARHRLI